MSLLMVNEIAQSLTGKSYVEGIQDCYGLLREFYDKAFDLELGNYARPLGFTDSGLNLIGDNLTKEGFQIHHGTPELGDALLLSIASSSPYPNHVGVYLFDNTFLHHQYQRPSEIIVFSQRWQNRLLNFARHPEVYTKLNLYKNNSKVSILDFIPPHRRTNFKG